MMPIAQRQYDVTAKTFHWVIVALIAIQLPLGWLMPGVERGTPPGSAMSVHISIGITILMLIVLRLAWRLTHPVVPDRGLPEWQRHGAELVHWLLYLVVLVTTLTGWFFASARGWHINLYGALPLPRLVEEGSPIGHAIGELHAAIVWVLVALMSVHILAAFVHLVVYRDRVMQRMFRG